MKRKQIIAFLSAASLVFGMPATAAYAQEDIPTDSHRIINGPLADEEDIRVIVQPQSQTYAYPDAVSFHVEVDHPEKIASYQWYLYDQYKVFELDGASAHTDTLVIPSTLERYGSEYYWCEMQDSEGNYIYSEEAELTCSNPNERFPLLYVGDYVLKPGESMDLSEYGLGSGVISLDQNGHDMTLDHVSFTNASGAVADTSMCPATGLLVYDKSASSQQYNINLIGDCVIENTFFDEEMNAGGVSLNSYFSVNYNGFYPNLVITGEGTLKATGGLRTVNSDGNVIIDADTRLENIDNHYCHGLYAYNVAVTDGHTLSIETGGDGINAESVVYFEDGARFEYTGHPVHLPDAPTSTSIILATDGIYIDQADVVIKGHVSHDEFYPYGRFQSAYNAFWSENVIYLDGARVSVDFSADETGSFYAANFNGFRGSRTGSAVITGGSEVEININSKDILSAAGVLNEGTLTVDEGSTLNINIAATQKVYGINSADGVTIKNADVNINVESLGEYNNIRDAGGIMSHEVMIDYTDPDYSLNINAVDGKAFIVGNDGILENGEAYDADYVPERFFLGENTVITEPVNAALSSGFHTVPARNAIETIYDLSDTSAPVSKAVISAKEVFRFDDVKDPEKYYYNPVYWAYYSDPQITTGTAPTTFSPNETVTRGQFVTFLYRAAGAPEVTGKVSFKDVAEDKFYYDAVVWAVQNGITTGVSADRFAPNEKCTRAQIVTFLYRFAHEPEISGSVPFTDVKKGSFYEKAVLFAYLNDITTGTTATTFSPDDTCTRGQAVTFLYRIPGRE